MLNLNSIMIGTDQIEVMAKFYNEVLGEPAMVDGEWSGWQVGSCFLSVGPHSEVKGKAKEPQRVLFNFETTEVKEEFERISKIQGAEVIKEPYTMGEMENFWIATIADPDGNYFQLMTPWEVPGESDDLSVN